MVHRVSIEDLQPGEALSAGKKNGRQTCVGDKRSKGL